MIIANSIYDTVFKRLMGNNRVARFFVETLIDEPIESITVAKQEYTYFRQDEEAQEPLIPGLSLTRSEIRRMGISVIRLDFVATIRLPDGTFRNVLIEIRKAKTAIDLMRFCNYLAEQYKRKTRSNATEKQPGEPLPIII